MDQASVCRFQPFVPGEPGYRCLAELLTLVWPEQPVCSGWLERLDAGRQSGRPFRREIAVDPRDHELWLGMAETGSSRWVEDARCFELQVHVHPAHRGRGIGAALYTRAASWAQGQARLLEAATRENRREAVRFLERRGFHLHHRHPVSELELGRFEPDQFSEVLDRVERSGLSLQSLAELPLTDERQMRRLYRLQAEVMRDAPGEQEATLPRFGTWRLSYQDNPDLLPEAHIVAFDGDRMVGLTQLWASQATDSILYTGFTGVCRSHRRRGIASALKVRSLGWARTSLRIGDRSPVVRTNNEESNPMLGINLHLGFREQPAFLRMVKKLEEPDRAMSVSPARR